MCSLRSRRQFTTAPFAKSTSPRACGDLSASVAVSDKAPKAKNRHRLARCNTLVSLRCRSRFTPSRFMAPHEAATPSSARRSQAAGAVVARSCSAPSMFRQGVVGCAGLFVCGGIQHNGVLCKAGAPVKSPALRVRIRGRYVLRPPGKCRHTSQSQRPSPAVRGSKTGLVVRHPFAFCCMVVPVYILSWCCRFALYVGGAFPLTSPHPPSSQVKQRHGRTRPHCHPLPWVNQHPRAMIYGLRPASPAG